MSWPAVIVKLLCWLIAGKGYAYFKIKGRGEKKKKKKKNRIPNSVVVSTIVFHICVIWRSFWGGFRG